MEGSFFRIEDKLRVGGLRAGTWGGRYKLTFTSDIPSFLPRAPILQALWNSLQTYFALSRPVSPYLASSRSGNARRRYSQDQ